MTAATTTKPNIYDAFTQAIAQGWSVIPVIGKNQIPLKWKKYQTIRATRDVAWSWIGQWPSCNLGIVTGQVSDLVVLDVDGPEGQATLAQFDALPKTVTALTGKGMHFYFRHPGVSIRNQQSFRGDLEGMDIRGDGGYVVGPGSVHESGAIYRWDRGRSPEEVAVADMPKWLVDLCLRYQNETSPGAVGASEKPQEGRATATRGNGQSTTQKDEKARRAYALAALNGEVTRVANAPDGTKHEQLLKSAIAVSGFVPTLSEQEIERALFDAIKGRAGDRHNALQTIRDGIRYGESRPREVPAKQEPPVIKLVGSRKAKEKEKEKAAKEGDTPEAESEAGAVRTPTQKYFDALADAGYSFTLNDLTDTVEVNGAPMDDITRSRIMNDVRDRGLKSITWAEDAINQLAGERRHHPVKDFLSSLQWDGKDHIAALAWHMKSEDPEWVETALQHWLLGAVGKALERAQNYMLVLAGPQNIGKSYLARWINPIGADYHVEGPIKPDDKDDRIRLIRNLTWEVGELGATTRRADVEALKSFVALQQVTVRKPYGRSDMEKPALASLIGTINPSGSGFLTDTTGNRRFVIVELTSIDRGYTSLLDPAQIWAQAVALYTGPECAELSVEEQAKRDALNEQHMLENPVQLYFDKCYLIEPESDLWIPAIDILQDMEIQGLKINQNETLKKLAEFLKKEGVEKGRPRQGSGEKLRASYRGIRRKPGI
jgi:hypothetical protein